MKNYQKTVLFLYPKLPRLVKDLTERIEIKAITSYNEKVNAEERIEKLIEYIYAKNCLEFWKTEMDELVSAFTTDEKYLLEYRYFRRKKILSENFAGYEMNCSERTYFRRQQRLAYKINAEMQKRNLTENKIENRLCSAFRCQNSFWYERFS